MPYEVKKSGSCPPNKPFGVFKKGSDKSLGCHANEASAQQQLRALYARESQMMGAEQEGEGTFRAREFMTAAEAVFMQETPEAPITADIVILKPGEGGNRRNYTQDAIDRAITNGFWEGSKMFVDHPADLRVPTKRPLTSLVAGLSNVRRGEAGEAIATATFYNKDFGRFAQAAKEHIGVSPYHYFAGQRYKGTDGQYHERVDELLVNHSVDFVAHPAQGGGIMQFLTGAESEDDVDWDEITPEMLKKNRPDLITAMAAEGQGNPVGDPAPQPPAPPTPPEPPEDVRKIVAEAIEAWATDRDKQIGDRTVAQTALKDLLGKSGLPEPVRNRLQGDLAERVTAENVEAIAAESIQSAKAELEALGVKPAMRGSGPSTAGGETPQSLSLADAAKQSSAIGTFFASAIHPQS